MVSGRSMLGQFEGFTWGRRVGGSEAYSEGSLRNSLANEDGKETLNHNDLRKSQIA
jgi:hypothetical protein